jgi:dihydroflavonol-4-reductase
MVCEAAAAKTPRCVPLWLARAGAPVVETWCSITKTRPLYTRMSLGALHSNRQISRARAETDLDYRPRPFRETLADTLAWFRENGRLPQKETA